MNEIQIIENNDIIYISIAESGVTGSTKIEVIEQIDDIKITISEGIDTFVESGTYNNGTLNFLYNTTSGFTVTGLFNGIPNTITGSGDINRLAKFSLSSAITNSNISDTGLGVFIDVETFITGTIAADMFIKSGGTSNQFLKADGSSDSNVYALNSSVITLSGQVQNNTSSINILNSEVATLSANVSTLSAKTDVHVTGGTYNNGTTLFTNNTGGTFSVDGYFTGVTNTISGTGTTNTIPKFNSITALTNSHISDTGSLVTISTDARINSLVVGKGTNNIFGNTAFGIGVLTLVTTGGQNTGIGFNALANIRTGFANTAIGLGSQSINSGGTFNTSIGYNSLGSLSGGSNNIGIGYLAGNYFGLSNGLLRTPNNSIFIGNNSKGNNDNQTNQIVIGDSSIGLGNNTTIIGNSATTITALKGNVIIGTEINNNIDNLQVSGSIITNSVKIYSGLSTQFLKANGTLDSTTYENQANKQNSMIIDGFGIKYPTVDATNEVVNISMQAGANTGFVNRLDTFNMTLTSSTAINVIGTSDGAVIRTKLFTPPFAPSDAIIHFTGRTYNASSITLTGDGRYFTYLGYDWTTDTILNSTTSFVLSDSILALGHVEVKRSGGTNTFTSFQIQPDISTVSNFDNVMTPNQATTKIVPNANLTVNNTAGVLKSQGINWGSVNSHQKNINTNAVTPFIRIDPAYLTTTSGYNSGTTVDTTTYWNGSALVSVGANNNFATIQRWLITLDGRLWLQAGEFVYTSKAAADAAVQSVIFTDILPADISIELCRMVATKGASDLTDTTKAQFYISAGGGSSAGGAGASFATIGGSPYDNTLLGIELNKKLNSYTGGTNVIGKGDSTTGLTGSNIIDNGSLITLSSATQVIGSITATTIVKNGGTSSQILMADGSVMLIIDGGLF